MSDLELTVRGIGTALESAGLSTIVKFSDGLTRDLPIGVEVRAQLNVKDGRTVRAVVAQVDLARQDGTPKNSWDVFYYHSGYAEIVRQAVIAFAGKYQIPVNERHDNLYN